MQLLPILHALRFNDRDTSGLEAIPRAAWPALLRATDRERLTLPLGLRCSGLLPPLVEARIQHNLDSNARQHVRVVRACTELAGALQASNLEFLMLKGLSKPRHYAADLRYRQQYDIDVYLPGRIQDARLAVEGLGYEAMEERSSRGADHLPRMIRKTGWKWRDDYFDPERPLAVELHFQFWNERVERFGVGDLTPFWDRRVVREVAGVPLPALSHIDELSYSALHLARHLLRGDLQLHHVYEMAHFLKSSARDETFWRDWSREGLASCRTLEAIAFRLSSEWFHCDLHPAAGSAIQQLPAPVQRWFKLFAGSPALVAGQSCKSELLLHLALIPEPRQRRKVVLQRLFPARHGRPVLDVHVPDAQRDLWLRVKGLAYEAGFMLKRAAHHASALALMLWSSFRWWRAGPSFR